MFAFKQFTVHQDRCAMKVCTDACLLGAWAAANLKQETAVQELLDIGTGTGLLSLMMAQETEAQIDAVELDPEAAAQAAENFAASPWGDRLTVHHSNIKDFVPQRKYDFIISNPPFFEGDLRSDDAGKNAAKHDTTLSLDELVQEIKRLLTEQGSGCLLIPFHRLEYLKGLLQGNGFFINKLLLIKQTEKHGFFRALLIFSAQDHAMETEEMVIHVQDRQYSEAFTALLKKFYLKL